MSLPARRVQSCDDGISFRSVLARGVTWFGRLTDHVNRFLTVLAFLVGIRALPQLALAWWAVALAAALLVVLIVDEGAYNTWLDERERVEDLVRVKRMHEKVAFGNPFLQGISNTRSKAQQLRRRIAALDDASPHVAVVANEVFEWSGQVIEKLDNAGIERPS